MDLGRWMNGSGQMDGSMLVVDRWIRTDGWILDGWMDGWIDPDRWMDGSGRMDGWMGSGWMDGWDPTQWMNGWGPNQLNNLPKIYFIN